MARLPDGDKSLMICLAVLTQYRYAMDRQADTQTDILRQQNPQYA